MRPNTLRLVVKADNETVTKDKTYWSYSFKPANASHLLAVCYELSDTIATRLTLCVFMLCLFH